MQKNLYWVYCLFGYVIIYGFTFYGVVVMPYAHHDDFFIWMYDPQNNFYQNPQSNFLAIQGRPLGGYLNEISSKFVRTIQDVSYLRLTSVLFCIASATGFAYWLKRNQVDGVLAFLIASGIYLAPGMQAIILWSISVPLLAVVFVSVLAGIILLPIRTSNGIVFASMYNMALIFLAVIVLVTGLYTYQSSVMMFLIFPLVRVLLAHRETFKDAWMRIQVEMAVFVLSCVTYFLAHRYISLPYLLAKYPYAQEQLAKHKGYQFKIISYWQINKKISLFFTQLIPNALDLVSYNYDFNVLIAASIAIIILAGAATVFYRGFCSNVNIKNKLMFVSYYLCFAIMVFLIFVMGNAPGLLAKGQFVNSRIYLSNSAMILILFAYSIYHLSGSLRPKWHIMTTRIILSVFIAGLCFSAEHNTRRSAELFSKELAYLESAIVPHIDDNPRIHIVRASWSKGDAYTPSTYYWWDIPWIIRSIYTSHNRELDFHLAQVSSGALVEPYEKASSLIVVDMNLLTDTFRESASSAPTVTLLQNDYMGFDILNINDPYSPYHYFAVAAGEYDLNNKSCPRDGCSKVYSGSSLESVIEWLTDNGMDFNVTSSPGVNGSFSPSKKLLDISPVWYTPAATTYPEWVRIDFHSARVVTGFKMQSPISHVNGIAVNTRMPKDFIFQGSHDAEHWEALLKEEGVAFEKDGEWKEWSFNNSTAYRHYRIYITANNGHPSLLSINNLRVNYPDNK